jgi:ubiquinone biosynthesis protein
MSIARYAGSVWRFFVICGILLRQIAAGLPRRIQYLLQPHSRKKIGKYLKTKQPTVSAPVRARETLERLGPTFIKFGQFLSVRPDLTPPEYCAEFRKLQDRVPPFPYDVAREELTRELGQDVEIIFSEFDQTPIAAASVAQVHRARLRDGEVVAVKIQRPEVREKMEEDILIMLLLARVAEKLIPDLRKNRLVMLLHEFSRWTARELDFKHEAQNAVLSRHYFSDYEGVRIPRVHLELSSERTLVMEFVHGANIIEAEPKSFERKATARLIADSMLKQIFADGFFHADPHGGNVFLNPDGGIAYVDFGIVGYLTPDMREWAFEILYAMARADVPRVIDSMLELCDADDQLVDVPAYRREMNEVLAELKVCQITNIPFTHMMQRFLNTSLEYGLDIPADLVIMSKALTTMEGTCLSLDPELRMIDCLRPFVEHYAIEAPDLDTALEKIKSGPFEVRRIRRLLLKHGARAAHMIERPTFRIEGREFRRAVNELEKTSLNLASGLLIAALVIFSATVSNTSQFEQWLSRILDLPDVPILSLVSLAAAAYLWLRLYLRNRPQRQPDHRPGSGH